ncbi:MAG: hypothetical protein WCC04_08115 [Terriglobales bacterium]
MALFTILLLCMPAFGQTVYAGSAASSGLMASGAGAGGAPLTYAARTDICESGTETGPLGCAYSATTCPTCTGPSWAEPMQFTGYPIPGIPGLKGLPVPGPTMGSSCGAQGSSSNNQYLCGINTTITDLDFGTTMVRATDSTLSNTTNYPCGGPNMGYQFMMGSDGALHVWASDSSKLLVSNPYGNMEMLSFDPSTMQVTPTAVCGTVFQSGTFPAFSGSNPQIIYELNTDQENTIFYGSGSGTCEVGENMTQAGSPTPTAVLEAINPGILMQLGPITPSTATPTGNGTWTGKTSGCTFTPASGRAAPPVGTGATGAPYVVNIYKGTITPTGAANPGIALPWAIRWSLLFEFNKVYSNIPASAAALFPAAAVETGEGANSCLPNIGSLQTPNYTGFNAGWNGSFACSDDDTSCSVSVGDNTQDGFWGTKNGNTYVGAVYELSYSPAGCRVLNTHTDMVTGDRCSVAGNAPYVCGQIQNNQHNFIAGSVTTTCGTGGVQPCLPNSTVGANFDQGDSTTLVTQQVTGAMTQFYAFGSIVNAPNATSGQKIFQPSTSGSAGWKTGVIYGTPDGNSAHKWCDSLGNCLTPSAVPVPLPFYFPTSLHDSDQRAAAGITGLSFNQGDDHRIIAQVQGAYNGTTTPIGTCTTAPGPCPNVTTVTIACTGAVAACPEGGATYTGITGGNFTATNHLHPDSQIALAMLGGPYSACSVPPSACHDSYLAYSLSDASAAPSQTILAVDQPAPTGLSTVFVIADPGAATYTDVEAVYTGAASGLTCTEIQPNTCPSLNPNGDSFINNVYPYVAEAQSWLNQSLLMGGCLDTATCEGHQSAGMTGDGRSGLYWWHNFVNQSLPCTTTGFTPCPKNNTPYLLSFSTPSDFHGAYGNHEPTDHTPVLAIFTHVCGQSSGTGSTPCFSPFAAGQALVGEIAGMQNSVTNPAAINCNYGDGPTACLYRLGHTFNSDTSWAFGAQNNIGNVDPTGRFVAFPSDWMETLGCADGTTNCWSSYIATGMPATSGTQTVIQTDSSSNITVTLSNQFCPPGGTQEYYVNSTTTSPIACGTRPAQITLSGFGQNGSTTGWANQTVTLTATGGTCTGPTSSANIVCTTFTVTAANPSIVPANYGPAAEPLGSPAATQKATPASGLSGAQTPAPRFDIWIASITTATQSYQESRQP